MNRTKNCSYRILDLVLTTCDVSVSTNALVNIDRLHPPLDIDIKLPNVERLPYVTSILRPNFFKADYDKLQEYLSSQDWDSLIGNFTDVNEMDEVFYETLQSAIKDYVPISKPKSKQYPPWFNKEIINALNEKKYVRHRFKIYKNPMDELHLKLLRRLCIKLAHVIQKLYQQHRK